MQVRGWVRDALSDRVRRDDASTRRFFMEVAEQIGPGFGLPIEMVGVVPSSQENRGRCKLLKIQKKSGLLGLELDPN